MPIKLDTPVRFVKGVGPRRAEMLSRAGIHSVEDLLKYKPFRYEDRTNFKTIAELRPDEEAVIQAKVAVTGTYATPVKRMQIFEMMVSDSSGSLAVKFFNQAYLERVFKKGQEVILFGAPRRDSYSLEVVLINPDYEIIDSSLDRSIHTGRIVPVYRKIGQLSTKILRQIIFQLLQDLVSQVEEPLPADLLQQYGFPDRRRGFLEVHFPECPQEKVRAIFLRELEENRTSAQRRFIFEEFFLFQLGLQVMKKQRHVIPKTRTITIHERVREIVKSILPFHPTAAQKRVLKEIVDDLCGPCVMSRLLQGDVGSGKTIVALQAMIVVIENGYQAALMAPTEILAEQHQRNLSQYLDHTPYRVCLLTGSVKGKRRKSILSEIAAGEINLVIGTHALIQASVAFKDLALIVVDEQHRFGVVQRSQLMEKGERPDTLVMTATPIPRTLALTLYGDLDLSIIDEMPPGRKPIRTLVKSAADREQVYRFLRDEVKKGRQAYVVYPLIEESEKVDLKAATEMAENLQDIFPEYVVGLMHGRLKADRKEELMSRFKAGKIHILVSTTVVEVGIDVPNATVMVVEHAERFGLSQLHQLRGRIGRGAHASVCILVADRVSSREAYERLQIMRRTNDGFKIAEKDLELRGPGQFLGTRQSGLPEFLFGNIVRDRELLEAAREEAEGFLAQYVKAAGRPEQEILSRIATLWKERYGLYNVG